MRTLAFALLLAVVGGCARRVEVQPTPERSTQVGLDVTNNASVPMNIVVVAAGNEIFLGQVAPNSTKLIAVTSVEPGTTVTLKATTADGTRTYSKSGVRLAGMYAWTVP
jgi:hypothetical protein